ncbi:MAG: type IV toxin-antitoxin system AbiEi family antitoxin [Gammaproteobacteria bacterium]
MKISDFITNLIAKGYNSFTIAQAKDALKVSDAALRAALRRLNKKGEIAKPLNGFYVIVPPEYRILGCRPEEHFINEMMEYLDVPYYIGLLSAAQYYGATHHRPQQLQIVTNQKRRSITCGRVRIVFIIKKDIAQTPTQEFNLPQGIVTVSTPEATIMDLIIYADRSGGLDNTLTVLKDLAKKISLNKLLKLIKQSKEITWAQRLGYLLELISDDKFIEDIAKNVNKRKPRERLLISTPKAPKVKFIKKIQPKKPTKNKKWKLIINTKLEPDS